MTAAEVHAALEQTEWPMAVSVLSYGVRFGVRASDPSFAEGLTSALPPGSERGELTESERLYSLHVEAEGRSRRPRNTLYVNDAMLARMHSREAILHAFERDVQLYVAEMAADRVFVHAGVVGWKGRAILLPGSSYAGKTTLVAELVRAGADYYSDEYAVLDAGGQVHPYPRRLSIRQAGIAGGQRRRADDLGGRTGTGPLPVSLVLLSQFKSGAEFRPRTLSPGGGILGLLKNCVSARRIPEIVLSTLRHVVSQARVVAGERGEASTVVGEILDLARQS